MTTSGITNRVTADLSDEAVIDRIVIGQQSNLFELLYNRYYEKVLDRCYGLLKNRQQATEFAEDIFSKVFEKLDSFKKRSSFASWLYSITYNHCIDFLRERKNLHYPEWDMSHDFPELTGEQEDYLQEINFDNLKIILDTIHPEEKALLIMKYHDGIPIKNIAGSLRISENAAKMRIKRARTRVLYLYQERFLKDN
jgi:RNA polymerase sigma-70 factor (ECF subfamily)